jgi:hypothetical protein
MNTKLTTTQLLELANALSISVQMHIMSQQQAAFVWKKHLREGGFLPPKDKMMNDE